MKTKELANLDFFTLLEEELEEKGRVRFRVKGTSMQPFLRDGREEVILRKCGNRMPSTGDICLFRFHGRHILHRLVSIRKGLLTFQGDNVITHGETCRAEHLVGVVEKVIRDGQELDPFPVKWRLVILLHRSLQRSRHLAGLVLRACRLRK